MEVGEVENYNQKHALYPEDLIGYLSDTQPDQWEKFLKMRPEGEAGLARTFDTMIAERELKGIQAMMGDLPVAMEKAVIDSMDLHENLARQLLEDEHKAANFGTDLFLTPILLFYSIDC